eukprot:scaffold7556_cov67-Skeletonema_dohrnii-CCMP3373.AAC.1
MVLGGFGGGLEDKPPENSSGRRHGFVADCRRAFLIPFSHAASFAFRFATHSFVLKAKSEPLRCVALLLLSSLAASVQNITMGVPAGPKLDFVGASEVREQERSKSSNHRQFAHLMFVLDVPNASYFLSPLTKPKRKIELQLHRCEDTTF